MLFIEDIGQVVIELGNWIDFQGSVLYTFANPKLWAYVYKTTPLKFIVPRSLCHTNSIQYHEQTTSTPHTTL